MIDSYRIGFLYDDPANTDQYPEPVVVVNVAAPDLLTASRRAAAQLVGRSDRDRLAWWRVVRDWEVMGVRDQPAYQMGFEELMTAKGVE